MAIYRGKTFASLTREYYFSYTILTCYGGLLNVGTGHDRLHKKVSLKHLVC